MKLKLGVGLAMTAIVALGLSACSTEKGGDDAAVGGGLKTAPATTAPAMASPSGGAQATSSPSAMAGAGDAATSLATASTSIGTIVVDGKGMTVYEYGNDVQGGNSSSCTGQCASNWPAVPAGSGTPTLQGVTGKVGTITGVDGKPQLTLNGWPLYYYVGDTAAGQTSGQGVGNIWWVLSPAGDPIGK